jgi:hypothetical protein
MRRYRGEEGFEIPPAMAIPTCQHCGSLWMDSAMVRDLGTKFEAQRQRRRSPEFLPRLRVETVRTRVLSRSPEDADLHSSRGLAFNVAVAAL